MFINFKRLIRTMMGLFVMAAMLAAGNTAVFAEDPAGGGAQEDPPVPAERMVYNSTDNFSTASGDGTWDDGIWSAQVLSNSSGAYTNLKYTCANATEWCSGKTGNWDATVVSGSKIQAEAGGTSEDWGVRTFTAPEKGTINLTSEACAESDGGAAFYFRIVLENSCGIKRTLFPESGDYGTYYPWGTVDAINIENIAVDKNDKIRYEIRRWGTSAKHATLPLVSTITYTEITEIDEYQFKTEYSSDENFKIEENVNGIWDGVWQGANYSTGYDRYAPLTTIVTVYTRLAPKNGMYSDATHANSSAVAGSVMKTKNGGSTDLVVNSFLVPRDGLVSIAPGILRRHKDLTLGNPAGQSGEDDATSVKVRIRVTRYATGETELLWPLNSEDGFAHGAVGKGDYLSTPELLVHVNWGDKIRFEFTEDPKSNNSQYFIWKQSVRYSPTLISESGKTVTDFKDAVAADVTAAIPAYSDLQDVSEAVALVVFYDNNGMMYDLKMQQINDFTQPIRIPLGEAKDLTAGSVKVLLLDSLQSLNPISIFGSEALVSGQAN